MIREVREETGLTISKPFYHGYLSHFFGQEDEPDWIVHIYSTAIFKGKLKENDEGVLKWFRFEEIPYSKMWLDDQYWLPLTLHGKKFGGEFFFNKNGSKLIRHNLRILSK